MSATERTSGCLPTCVRWNGRTTTGPKPRASATGRRARCSATRDRDRAVSPRPSARGRGAERLLPGARAGARSSRAEAAARSRRCLMPRRRGGCSECHTRGFLRRRAQDASRIIVSGTTCVSTPRISQIGCERPGSSRSPASGQRPVWTTMNRGSGAKQEPAARVPADPVLLRGGTDRSAAASRRKQ